MSRYYTEKNGNVILELQVKTNSNKQKLVVFDDSIDIYVKASPTRGQANREIIELIADILGENSSKIDIIYGHRNSIKKIRIFEIDHNKIEKRLSRDQRVQMRL